MLHSPKVQGSRFWLAQGAFWIGFWLFAVFGGIEYLWANGEAIILTNVMARALIPTGIGFAITYIFAVMLQRVKASNEWILLLVAGPACLIGAFAFSILHFEMKYWFGIYPESQLYKVIPVLLYTPSRFLILVSWTLAYLFLFFSGEASRQRAHLAQLEEAAARSRADMLRYQMNPHLLFNALNTVSGHVLNNDAKSADIAIQSLSDLLRESLDDDAAADNTLTEEIGRVQLYLDVERTRFGDRLRTRFKIAEDVRSLRLPKLILQPLVENALKHGLARSSQGGELAIVAKPQGEFASITVRNKMPIDDLGVGEERKGFGLGLANVEERLALHYGGAASFKIAEQTRTVFAVNMRIPLSTDAAL